MVGIFVSGRTIVEEAAQKSCAALILFLFEYAGCPDIDLYVLHVHDPALFERLQHPWILVHNFARRSILLDQYAWLDSAHMLKGFYLVQLEIHHRFIGLPGLSVESDHEGFASKRLPFTPRQHLAFGGLVENGDRVERPLGYPFVGFENFCHGCKFTCGERIERMVLGRGRPYQKSGCQ